MHAKQRDYHQNTSLHVLQISPVILRMENNVIRIRITSPYGSQSSFVVFAYKTAPLGPEFQASVSQPSFVVFAYKTATLGPEFQVSMCSRPHLWFCEFKTATLAPEFQVSNGPRPHLSFCACKTA